MRRLSCRFLIQESVMTVASPSLVQQLATQLQRPVDAPARQRAAALLVDWLGCALGGLRGPLAQQLQGVVASCAPGPCTALSAGQHDIHDALLINAALGNVLEMDDVHRAAILHPGPVVIPVALAATQRQNGNGHDLLDAIVRGYEATIRVGRALGTSHYRYWHPTSTAGAFGATAAAASVLGLDATQTADALGTAGSRTGGLWQMRHESVPTKSLHNAQAAQSGWQAALLAQAGLRGPRYILEGEQGLFAATAPQAEPALVVAAEADWLIHSTSLKPWPACRHAHPAIDALHDALASGRPGDGAQVVAIEVATYAEALRFCDRAEPQTALQAKFSLQHALAAICAHGTPVLAHYTDAACADPAIARLRSAVQVVEDAACSARFPAHYGANVRVQLADGRVLQAQRVDAWGDPEQPMHPADIDTKAMELAQWGGVEPGLAHALIVQVRNLAEGGTLDTLTPLLSQVSPCH
ncbi:MmgE/PrpD family protein [Stenotrophomonas ginsengisoli]|nr:MmgE/PrpD family protein [Stenotrophomonas ginsengisoli]